MFQSDADAFAHSANVKYASAFRRLNRRSRGAEQRRGDNANAFDLLSHDALLQRFDVNDDVRQFGHGNLRLKRFKG